MLWVKALHVFFMVSWFAGLFYLPRLYVYHADTHDDTGNERFKVMERKLYIMMTIGGVGTLIFGAWLMIDYAWAAYSSSGWLHAKLFLVFLLYGFHFYCGHINKIFRENRNTRDHKFFRKINEIPTLLGLAIIILVFIRPF
ncbi:MAG: CopD family protein [Gammaproteobacteria bacterium]|nr:CopD family protein [Gammaproteobacteria bacterium]